jgi:hypothetical protein
MGGKGKGGFGGVWDRGATGNIDLAYARAFIFPIARGPYTGPGYELGGGMLARSASRLVRPALKGISALRPIGRLGRRRVVEETSPIGVAFL